jgi:hypothetical protein
MSRRGGTGTAPSCDVIELLLLLLLLLDWGGASERNERKKLIN